ncbi:MAG: sugar nucleotide-binding protein, partial [Treponema sp.]|nr:sugar nucleotide-binding protein [Treponema sp.]
MIWVTGCKGLLGSEICRNLEASDLYWQGTDTEVDVTSYEEILKFVKEIETKASFPSKIPHEYRKINWIINCASYYPESESEENKEKIFDINSKGITNLARVCREIGAKVINISYSDVFDGSSKEAYTEESIKNPQSLYGQALNEGEFSLRKEMNQYYIIRNSFIYGLDSKNYFCKLINQLRNESNISIPNDVMISPVNSSDLAHLVTELIQKSITAKAFFGKNSAPSYGIYNFADYTSISLYDFAKEVN